MNCKWKKIHATWAECICRLSCDMRPNRIRWYNVDTPSRHITCAEYETIKVWYGVSDKACTVIQKNIMIYMYVCKYIYYIMYTIHLSPSSSFLHLYILSLCNVESSRLGNVSGVHNERHDAQENERVNDRWGTSWWAKVSLSQRSKWCLEWLPIAGFTWKGNEMKAVIDIGNLWCKCE